MNEIVKYGQKTVGLPAAVEEKHPFDTAFDKLAQFFQTMECNVLYDPNTRALTMSKGSLILDCKVMENRNVVHVTSSRDYNPEKAGTKESRAKITNARSELKARHVMRVVVTGKQSVPIFVELRKNLLDPERSIIQGVMFVLQSALDRNSTLHQTLIDGKFLEDVPKEWLPDPRTVEKFPELMDFMAPQKRLPAQSSVTPEE